MKDLTTKELEQVIGGNQRSGELFLSAAMGAAEGVTMCMQTGVVIHPGAMVACAVGGAALGMVFPH